jgi:hypothetical protein
MPHVFSIVFFPEEKNVPMYIVMLLIRIRNVVFVHLFLLLAASTQYVYNTFYLRKRGYLMLPGCFFIVSLKQFPKVRPGCIQKIQLTKGTQRASEI